MDFEGGGNQGGEANALHFPSPSNNADNRFIFESDNIHSRDFGRG